MLKEKLWKFIIHNFSDLILDLQKDFSLTGYLERKVFNVQTLIPLILIENKPE